MARKKKSTDTKPSEESLKLDEHTDGAAVEALKTDDLTTEVDSAVEETPSAETGSEDADAEGKSDEAQADSQGEAPEGDEPMDDAVNSDSDVLDAAPEEATTISEVTPDAPAAPVVVKKGGMGSALVGGVLCVAIGYAAAQFVKPEGWPFPGADTQALSDQIDALSADVAAMKEANTALTAELESKTASLADTLTAQVNAIDLDAKVAPLDTALGTLESRMTSLEARPVAEAIVSPEATAAYEKQLAEMRSLLDSEVARLEAAQTAAAAQTAEAKASTALANLAEAINRGEPFEQALAEIELELPEAIIAAAPEGVAGVTELQDAFAPAARAALTAAARSSYETGDEGIVGTFLRTQLGLRSLTPKEGDSADAVLSRAEAAVREADFATALTELALLPDAGKPAVEAWSAAANARLNVTNALQALTGQ